MAKQLPVILTTLATIFYGTMPVVADLSDSHLLNPSWMPHARFHLALLLSTNSLLALYALYLIWIENKAVQAGLMGIFVMSGFWVAALTRNFYGGSFVDPDLYVSEIMVHTQMYSLLFLSRFFY